MGDERCQGRGGGLTGTHTLDDHASGCIIDHDRGYGICGPCSSTDTLLVELESFVTTDFMLRFILILRLGLGLGSRLGLRLLSLPGAA